MAKVKNIYHQPILKEDIKLIVSDPNVHNGKFEYALDYLLPIGIKVYAALDGKVTACKSDAVGGGFEDQYKGNENVNFIVISHPNNEYSQYIHLKTDGVLVSEGDEVKQGDLIGYSGNTGYSTRPHLHFDVHKMVENGIQTLELNFIDSIRVIRGREDATHEEIQFSRTF